LADIIAQINHMQEKAAPHKSELKKKVIANVKTPKD